jgi:hypothetical protein
MNATEIKLSFNKADFEEVFFRNGADNIFHSKNVKQQFVLSILAGLFFSFSLIYSIATNKWWGALTVVTLIFVLLVNELVRKISPVMKWKRSIKDFLNAQAKFMNQKIALSENAITLQQDTTLTTIPWKDFKKVVIDDKSIGLYGDTDFIFPRKSMAWHEFELLCNEILSRVKS